MSLNFWWEVHVGSERVKKRLPKSCKHKTFFSFVVPRCRKKFEVVKRTGRSSSATKQSGISKKTKDFSLSSCSEVTIVARVTKFSQL